MKDKIEVQKNKKEKASKCKKERKKPTKNECMNEVFDQIETE